MGIEFDFFRDRPSQCIVEDCPRNGWEQGLHLLTDDEGDWLAAVCVEHWPEVIRATSLPLRCNCIRCYDARDLWLGRIRPWR